MMSNFGVCSKSFSFYLRLVLILNLSTKKKCQKYFSIKWPYTQYSSCFQIISKPNLGSSITCKDDSNLRTFVAHDKSSCQDPSENSKSGRSACLGRTVRCLHSDLDRVEFVSEQIQFSLADRPRTTSGPSADYQRTVLTSITCHSNYSEAQVSD